jgi:hypothetical protein
MRARVVAAASGSIALAIALGCNWLVGNHDPTLAADVDADVDVDVGAPPLPPPPAEGGGRAPVDAGCPDGAIGCPNGKCVDPRGSDPDNCGDCERSCGGGACEAGACAPVLISSLEVVPSGLDVDDDPGGWVYWSTYGGPREVRRIRKAGPDGTRETLYASSDPSEAAMEVGITPSRLYWVANVFGETSALHSALPDGGDHHAAPIAGAGYGYALALDGTWAYGGTYAGLFHQAAIGRVPEGDAAAGAETVWSSDAGVFDLAADPSALGRLYWSDESSISTAAKDGTGQQQLFPQTKPGAVAVDATKLYFVDETRGAIVRVDKATGACAGASPCPEVLVGAPYVRSPHRLRVRDGMLYWINNVPGSDGASSVVRSEIAGTGVTVLAQLPGEGYGIAVDASFVYVSIQRTVGDGPGSIWRVAR